MVFGGVRRRLAWEWRQAGGGFLCHCAAAAADHVDADHGDDFLDDVELDEDLDDVVYSLMSFVRRCCPT